MLLEQLLVGLKTLHNILGWLNPVYPHDGLFAQERLDLLSSTSASGTLYNTTFLCNGDGDGVVTHQYAAILVQDTALVTVNFCIREDGRHALEKILRIMPGLETDNVVAQQTSIDCLGHVSGQGGLPIAEFGPGNVNELLEDHRPLVAVLADYSGSQVEMIVLEQYHGRHLFAVKLSTDGIGKSLIGLAVSTFPGILYLFWLEHVFKKVVLQEPEDLVTDDVVVLTIDRFG